MKKTVVLIVTAVFFFLPAARPMPLSGVFLDITGMPDEAIAPAVDADAQSGFNAVRLLISWKAVEPSAKHFDFSRYDAAIRAAREKNMEILAALAFAPDWAAGTSEDSGDARSKMMPNDLRQWERYVAVTVKRYRDKIHRWQIWEKPSIDNFEGTDGDYFDLLHVSYRAIKKIDPAAVVFASEPGGPDLGFIQSLFSHPGDFDGVALAPELESPFAFSEYWKMIRKVILPAHPEKRVWVADWKLPPQDLNRNVSPDYLEGAYTAAAATGVGGFFAPEIFNLQAGKEGVGPDPNSIPGPACVEFSPDGDKEEGLFTRKFRTMQKANPGAVIQDDLPAAEFDPNDSAFLYVDVDDRFIFFNPDRSQIKITVHADASDSSKKAGMNLMYDSPRGYVFSPWMTITPGAGWKDYEWILTDANFADKGGFDFRLSDLGSAQSVYVSKICVDKL